MFTACVIGGGPAGMVAATTLRGNGAIVTAFDSAPGPGGLWRSHCDRPTGPRGVNSPVYSTMCTVLPKDFMSFTDHRFPFLVPHFPHHSAVLAYLQDYGEKKGAIALTRYNTMVQSVRWVEEQKRWSVTSVNHINGDVFEWRFDAVIVATGRHHSPFIPTTEAIEQFQANGGSVLHSSDVRRFREYRGKKVVVVGGGVGGFELASEIHRVVPQSVHHSRGHSGTPSKATQSPVLRYLQTRNSLRSRNVVDTGPIESVNGRDVVLRSSKGNGPSHVVKNCDAILFATGYRQQFPFLDPKLTGTLMLASGVEAPAGNAIIPSSTGVSSYASSRMYYGCICKENPTLAFMGLQEDLVFPFMVYEAQAKVISYVLSRRVGLPTGDDATKIPDYAAHYDAMGRNTVPYYNALIAATGFRYKYWDNINSRRMWFVMSCGLSWAGSVRAYKPLLRKEQHIHFSNKI